MAVQVGNSHYHYCGQLAETLQKKAFCEPSAGHSLPNFSERASPLDAEDDGQANAGEVGLGGKGGARMSYPHAGPIEIAHRLGWTLPYVLPYFAWGVYQV